MHRTAEICRADALARHRSDEAHTRTDRIPTLGIDFGCAIGDREGSVEGAVMALSNFLLTVAAVGAGFVLLKGDVRRSAVNLRRNLKHVKTWLEQEQAASKGHAKPKEVEGGTSEKVPMKEEKH